MVLLIDYQERQRQDHCMGPMWPYIYYRKRFTVTLQQSAPIWISICGVCMKGFISKTSYKVIWIGMPLVEQERPTLPEHMSSPPVFSGVRVTRSLVLCVCFVDRCLSFCPFSFSHCVACSSSIEGPCGSMS
jgi:hypothetical protein